MNSGLAQKPSPQVEVFVAPNVSEQPLNARETGGFAGGLNAMEADLINLAADSEEGVRARIEQFLLADLSRWRENPVIRQRLGMTEFDDRQITRGNLTPEMRNRLMTFLNSEQVLKLRASE